MPGWNVPTEFFAAFAFRPSVFLLSVSVVPAFYFLTLLLSGRGPSLPPSCFEPVVHSWLPTESRMLCVRVFSSEIQLPLNGALQNQGAAGSEGCFWSEPFFAACSH